MKPRDHAAGFRTLMIVLIFTLVALPVYGQTEPKGFYIAPYIQNVSPEAVTIMWESPQQGGMVEYGPLANPPRYDKQQNPVNDDTIRKARIIGLKPGTDYTYRVRAGEAVHTGVFTTAPAENRPVRFAILGDSRFWKDYWQSTRLPEHFMSQKPEFVLHTGDLVSKGTDLTLWPDHFTRFASISGQIPIIPVRGNHEQDGRENPESDWFARYHDLPGGEPLTTFDWGNTHFALVSYTHMPEAPQLLDADLAKTDKPFKVVMFHYPVYSTGYYGPQDDRKSPGNPVLEAVFDRHRVDLVIAGHTHIYERCFAMRWGRRDDNNGTLYLVQGGAVGGNYPDWWTAKLVTEMDMPHYTMVDISNDTLELRSFGLAKGDRPKGMDARIIEVDRYIKWRDEALPKSRLATLASVKGDELLQVIDDLGAMVYAPAAGQLVGYLSSSDNQLCRKAAAAIENIANPDVADQLIAHLDHADVVVQRHLARSLEKAMPATIADKIAALAVQADRDPQVRINLMGALQLHSPKDALSAGMKTLADSNEDVRHRAADVVKRTATKKEVPALIELFEQQTDTYVAECLAWGLNRVTGATVHVKRVVESTGQERAELISRWKEALRPGE